MLDQYLYRLGLTGKEQMVYLAVSTLGTQPASVIAKHAGLDRVTTYRYLKKLSDIGLLKSFVRSGVQCFASSHGEGIEQYLKQKIADSQSLLGDTSVIDKTLRLLSRGESTVPILQIFEGKAGIKRLFRDVLHEAKEQQLIRIRMLTSNTLEQQLGDLPLSKFVAEFFEDLKKRNVSVEIFEAAGTLIPEYVHRVAAQTFRPDILPASRGATNVLLAGSALYLACYDDSQVGLKIKHLPMSQIFHFFFDLVAKQAPLVKAQEEEKLPRWMKGHS